MSVFQHAVSLIQQLHVLFAATSIRVMPGSLAPVLAIDLTPGSVLVDT
jgi:hypothetical protein